MRRTTTFTTTFGRNMFFAFGILGLLSLAGVGAWHARVERAEDPAENEENENPADDLEGALEYEFNMTKDPAIGTIPEGTFEAERAQAAEIAARQQRLNIPEVGSYSFVGPDNLGGRTRTVVYDARYNGDTNRTIMAGGVSGGVYKSTDDGASWTRKSPLGEHFSCTSIAQDRRPGFQDTWYYAVGESTGNSASGFGASYFGNGVYKSTDNGETWVRLPTSNTSALETFSSTADAITRIVVDPTNGNVYIAAIATILRSTDGGATWGAVLAGTFSSSSQFTDIAVTSTGRFYAGFGGSNSASVDGVWTSTTGASGSWTQIAGVGAGGSPAGWNAEGSYGRLVLAIAPSSENVVYAMYFAATSSCTGTPAPEAELFRWDNNTSSWANLSATLPDESGCLNGNDPFAVQGGYDLVVAVKPDDPATIFIGGTNIYRSTDTGATWTRIGGYATAAGFGLYAGSHPDIHAIVFQPNSSTTMLCGNDGGVQRTTNNLASTVAWTPINSGYRTYQYYYVANDPRASTSKVIGGAQDNGTTRNTGGSGSTFESIFGGDGVSVGMSDLIGGVQYEYVGSQNGVIFRRASTIPSGGSSGDPIRPTGSTSGLFITLFKLDPDNTDRLYYAGANTLYRTASASTVAVGTWTAMTGVATAVGAGNISSIGLSRGPYNAATSSLFVGTSLGKVFRLDDPTGAAADTIPVNITGAGFPLASNVSSISVNPTNDDIVLVTFSNYGVTSVFWTGNANSAVPTWTAVEGNLTLPSYRSSAIINTPAGLQYFVGTSAGLYSATGLPTTPTWTQEGPGTVGNAVVSSLDLRAVDNKLLVGTHGYGMWTSSFPVGGRAVSDFDGDGKSDVAVWRETDGVWYMMKSSNNTFSAVQFGVTADKIVPGDYDGDGKTDVAVYRPSTGTWYVLPSTGGFTGTQFGLSTDLPAQGDFDGDGKTDIAVFRPSTGTWYQLRSTAGFAATQFGANGDKPVVGDYDGDGKSDIAVYRPSDGVWYQLRSSLGFTGVQFGIAADKVVPADYDGDGKTDLAVYRDGVPGIWYLLESTGGFVPAAFGTTNDIPTPGDFDGDGKTDVSVYRPSIGTWYLLRSTSGFAAQQFGSNGDKPVEAGYVPVQ